jgi:hypothetical protein
MVYMHRSLGESCSGVGGPWRCRGAEEALGIVRLLCSNTLSVRLFWLGPTSTRCTFSRLHGGESIRLEGLTSGPGSPEPLKPWGDLTPCVTCPCMTLSAEQLTAPRMLGSVGEAPSHRCSGSLSPARALVGAEGRGGKNQVQTPVDREPKAQASPRAPSRGRGRARAWARPNP